MDLKEINFLHLLILALACFRVSVMLANVSENGPGNILQSIRYKMGVRWGQAPVPVTKPGSIAELALCTYCNSVWFGLLFSLFYWIMLLTETEYLVLLFLPLSLSGFVVLIEKLSK